MRVRLKRIRRCNGVRIDGGQAFMRAERVGQNRGDQILGVLIFQMDQVAGAIECESILRETSAQTSDPVLFFKNNWIVLEEVIPGAESGKTAADNDYFLLAHECMSTFIRR